MGKPRKICKANRTATELRAIRVSEPANLSACLAFSFCLSRLYRLQYVSIGIYVYLYPSSHDCYIYFYACTSIRYASRESVIRPVRYSIDDRFLSPPLRPWLVYSLNSFNRSSQPNFKLFRRVLISEKRRAEEISFSRRQVFSEQSYAI